MNVNGVANTGADAYSAYTSSAKQTNTEKAPETKAENNGVVYEPSSDKTSGGKKTYKPNQALVSQLKADADARNQQMLNLVHQMMSKQGNAYGQANDIWKFLAGGKYTVDAATKAQAQKDIAEDGYWGVNQTSDRIVDFAKALTGGDPSKIEEMRKAFDKGFRQATHAWGKQLPGISSSTYDAVMKKFDAWEQESNTQTDNMNNNPIV